MAPRTAGPRRLTTDDVLRIAVASDLHAYDRHRLEENDPEPSFFEIGAPESPVGQHPIAALRSLIGTSGLRAHILLCPGDLGEKATPAATKHAWTAVHSIGDSLGASAIVGTAGNHDVDSRYAYNDYDAKGFLQSLIPSFPVAADATFDRYWSRHFAILTWPELRLVILNSSAYHGSGPDKTKNPPEYGHGRISELTLQSLSEALRARTDVPLNVLLCHHHPSPFEEFGLGAADVMDGGAELVRILGEGHCGQWLIIHGHKHFPKLLYAQGTTAITPTIFAAGSLCVRLQSEISASCRNQFYILDFSLNDLNTMGLVGRFRSWDWVFGVGWQPAQEHSGLPCQGGFGFRENRTMLKTLLAEVCSSQPQTTWSQIVSAQPRLRYLMPHDLRLLLDALEEGGRFRVMRGSDGLVLQIDSIS
jgi:Calcineurin-like phosphoesterase